MNKYIDYVQRLCDTQIEHFMQYVSVDSGIPEHAEYIRNGLNYSRLRYNCSKYLIEVTKRNSLTFIVTMNNLSVLGIKRLLQDVLDYRRLHSDTYQRVWFDTPLLRQPTWQSLQILPPVYAQRLTDVADWMEENLEHPDRPFQGFKDYEVQRLERDIAWMRSGQKHDHSQAKADFHRFFSEHDRRRGTDFKKTFPEMVTWWHECEYYARVT
jgi:hypothetical protein